MGIFTKAPVFFQKYLKGYRRAQNSPVMKKILSDPNIAKSLDEPKERQEFYNKLKEYEEGGITKEEIQRTLGYFRSGKGKFVSGKEGYEIAKKMMPDSRDRYKYSSTWDCGTAKNSDSALSSRQAGSQAGSPGYSSGRVANVGSPSAIMSKNYNYRRTGSQYSNPTGRTSNVSKAAPIPKKT